MEQNPENPNPSTDWQPETTPALVEESFTSVEPTAATEQVIDVHATDVIPPASPAPSEPPLQLEILSGSPQPPAKNSSNGWVVALVILIVLCCCCVLAFAILTIFGRVFVSVFGAVYSTIISILNSIFGGTVQFY